MRAMQVYPMDERAPLRAIAMSRGLLERGESVVWFPEGWRSPDGTLQPFLPGIGRLLEQFPVTVVPLCIDGTFEAFPRDKRFPKLRPVRLVIGEPVEPAAWHSLLSEKSEPEQRIAAFLREAVLSLKSVAAKEA
jgi:long-chain acyl-CoA synthetase